MLTRISGDLPPHVEDVMTRVIGACIEVHRQLGPGFLESTYERAVCVELRLRGIAFEQQKAVDVVYKGERLHSHRLDLVVEACVVLEVKAVNQLEEIHGSQVVSYLRATGLTAGLLVNFNAVVLKAGIRRIVRTKP
ncbi:MAG TPA: GxxExxY protein [Vicinamibacterales bacterium]|nr:GxxExxY protein [Vicinamibacterales bacterium]